MRAPPRMTEAYKAIGLHNAMYVIPILALAAAAVLFAASRTMEKDVRKQEIAHQRRVAANALGGARLPSVRGKQCVAEARQMVIGIAEGEVDHGEPLEVVAHDEFIHHAHTAVHLHGLLADQSACLPDVRLRGGDGASALGGIRRIGVDGGDDGHGTRLLGRNQHVGHVVLECLKGADRDAELLAGLQIIQGRLDSAH